MKHEDEFHRIASEAQSKASESEQAHQAELDGIKSKLAQTLSAIKAQLPLLNQLKQSHPETVQAVLELVQNIIALARRPQTLQGGVGDSTDPASLDQEQLSAGIEEESEHTSDLAQAQEIAVDHLTQDPTYYQKEIKKSEVKDFSHLLPEKHKNLRLESDSSSGRPHVKLYDGHKAVGYVQTLGSGPTSISPHSDLESRYRGQGLGVAMYEAAYAHAKELGFDTVRGSSHSEDASRVHRALAQKHGYQYKATPYNDDDSEFKPYEYSINKASTDLSLGDIAKMRVMSPIGDPDFHPNETIKSVHPIKINNSGIEEDMYVLHTSTPQVGKRPGSGRILLSFDDKGGMLAGGLYHISENGVPKLQSGYVDSDFRGGKATPLLVSHAKRLGIASSVGPASDDWKKFADRYGFPIYKSEPEADEDTLLRSRLLFERELDPSQPVPDSNELDKAGITETSNAFVGDVPQATGHLNKLPAGTIHNGKMKIKRADGSAGWIGVRNGMIQGQTPDSALFGANSHPVSSLRPNTK